MARNEKQSVDYITEKFQVAVYDLATGVGDVRSRVGVAYYRFWLIEIDEFPEELRDDRKKITYLLTRLGGEKGYIIPGNLRKMKNKTAAQIAGLILHIYFGLAKTRGCCRAK